MSLSVEQSRLEELHRLWDLLLQKTKEKGMRLLQAQKLVQYLRECEDAMDWISDKVRLRLCCYLLASRCLSPADAPGPSGGHGHL